jgi:hypothetical protein
MITIGRYFIVDDGSGASCRFTVSWYRDDIEPIMNNLQNPGKTIIRAGAAQATARKMDRRLAKARCETIRQPFSRVASSQLDSELVLTVDPASRLRDK